MKGGAWIGSLTRCCPSTGRIRGCVGSWTRGWGALRIECRDLAHREKVNGLITLLRPPLEALQLARQITLVVQGHEPLTYPVTVPLPSSLLA